MAAEKVKEELEEEWKRKQMKKKKKIALVSIK